MERYEGASMGAHERWEESMNRPMSGETKGMRFAFWSWATIVVAGLAVMIVLPLSGR